MKANTTKEKLLDAGLMIFASHGYAGATTKGIARHAGVAEITLFRHFESKEKLFQELLTRYSFLPAMKGLLPKVKELSYRDALLLLARGFFDILIQRKELIRILHAELIRSAKPNAVFVSFMDDNFRTMASLFKLFQKKGLLRRFKPEIAARAFLGLFISFFLMEEVIRKKPMNPKERDAILREFVEIFVRGTESGPG